MSVPASIKRHVEDCRQDHAQHGAREVDAPLVGADDPPPAAPAFQRLGRRGEGEPGRRELHLVARQRRRDVAGGPRHAVALVASPAGQGQVDDAAGPRVGGERADQEPVRPLRKEAEGAFRGVESDQARCGGAPRAGCHEDDRQHQEPAQDGGDQHPVEDFQRALDPLAHHEHGHTGREGAHAEPVDEGRVLGARQLPEEQEEHRPRRCARPCRPAHLEHVQSRVEDGPEARRGLGPHEAREHGFARGQRPAHEFGVEHRLQKRRRERHPQKNQPVLDERRRPQQELAASDRRPQHDDARTHDAGPRQPLGTRRWGKFRLLEGRQSGPGFGGGGPPLGPAARFGRRYPPSPRLHGGTTWLARA